VVRERFAEHPSGLFADRPRVLSIDRPGHVTFYEPSPRRHEVHEALTKKQPDVFFFV